MEDEKLLELQETLKANLIPDIPDQRDHIPLMMTTEEFRTLVKDASVVDYTDKMSPVKNQGTLGSCVGFAVVAMKEYQEQMEHNKELSNWKHNTREEINYDLSEQWLYYKCKEIDSYPNMQGTSIRFAMKVLNKIGVPCESGWPYNADYKGSPKFWASQVAKWAVGGEYIRLITPEDIIKSLRENGPVPVGVGCFREMFYTKSDGYIPMPQDPSKLYGGHAICICAYYPAIKRFKFKNSWGGNWGEKGYGYLDYNYIKNYCWDAWEIKDVAVSKIKK